MSEQLESANWDGVSLDIFSVDEDTLVADDIDDGGQLSVGRTVVDSDDATDLNESVVALT